MSDGVDKGNKVSWTRVSGARRNLAQKGANERTIDKKQRPGIS